VAWLRLPPAGRDGRVAILPSAGHHVSRWSRPAAGPGTVPSPMSRASRPLLRGPMAAVPRPVRCPLLPSSAAGGVPAWSRTRK
jgi:hypothetical protein